MYRILIVDDEPDIREGLAGLIAQRAPRWEVAATAADGVEAMEKARQTLPDAVLTDICMPHVNGLDFLENLLGEMPDTKLLILSGYDQFDYAVQALRIGVSDFLLKPLETYKLLDVLERLADSLDAAAVRRERAKELHARLEKDSQMRLERYFERALRGHAGPAPDGPLAGYVAGSGYCCALCDAPDPSPLEELLEQRLGEQGRLALLPMGGNAELAAVFWTTDAESSQNFFLELHHILSSVAVQYRRTTGQDVRFFLGGIVDNAAGLRNSYRQCLEAKHYAFPEQAAAITTYKDTLESSLAPCPQVPETLEKELTDAVKCGNEGTFYRCCGQLMDWFRQENIQNADYTRMCVLSLCYAILRDNRNVQKMSYYEFVNFQKEIMAAASLEELRTLLESFARLNWISQRGTGHVTLKARVEAIVEENLQDVDFSLDVVAGKLFLSPNYLRYLYKQESGQTFTEYLTARRMRRAKMLLGNPKLRIGDVAEQCGYADPRYFSSCFKKYYHMTPSEYQLSARGGNDG